MTCVYFITAKPTDKLFSALLTQLNADLLNKKTITQCFFYSEAVAVGEFEHYPNMLQAIIDQADEHDIALNLCSAAFELRKLRLSPLAQQDFLFKGLGQLVIETQKAELIRVINS